MTAAADRRLAAAVRGGLVGIAATVPMSVLMGVSDGVGIMPGQPPRRIVGHLLPGLADSTADALTVVSHALYGAAAGAVFTVLPLPRRIVAPIGVAFGLVIWAVGYEGWVPVLGVLPPAHRDHPGRVATMVAAHLVFGAALGRFARR